LSAADHSVSPPKIDIPRDYSAAYDLIERNLRSGLETLDLSERRLRQLRA